MFNFRLQRILELREKAEQAKARELASAQDLAESARRERDALAALHATSRAEVDAAHRTEPRIGHLQQLGLVLQSLDQRLESAGETVRAADEVVDSAQKLLDAASRDRRVLDRLKVRHTDQWRVEEAHKDRLGMDEIALSRFSRNAEARTKDDSATRSRSDDEQRESTRNDGSTL
ncbi:MAG: flagellar export protein FliJ [Gemmatimonadaceae bacterium]|nr:flagellar export protein FliJ [Gemmatimonadaceae bacterium]